MVRHFLDVNSLSSHDAFSLIQRARVFKQTDSYPSYPKKTLANLFYETSTRTRVSFELAAKKLGLTVVNIDLLRSSESKGEMIEDTLKTLALLGVDLAVIRHEENGLPEAMALKAPTSLQVINAGDGTRAHPTQAMLDVMTIIEQKPAFPDLKIAVVGNLIHSRVAHSLQALCRLFQVREFVFVAPEPWLPREIDYGYGTTSLREGLDCADVVVTLRVQRERFGADDFFNRDDYRRDYAITPSTLAYAKSDAIVMHPGPLNRGLEIDSAVADGPQSCIWDQVRNGLFMRMAIIDYLLAVRE